MRLYSTCRTVKSAQFTDTVMIFKTACLTKNPYLSISPVLLAFQTALRWMRRKALGAPHMAPAVFRATHETGSLMRSYGCR